VHIAAANWWSIAPEVLESVRDSPLGAAGHACEIETSLMLAITPSLVQQRRGATVEHHPHPEWAGYDFNYPSRVMLVEMIHVAAPDGVIGLPELATAAKGQRLLEDVVQRTSEFIREFSTW
jgi:creatinine amidohydrolase